MHRANHLEKLPKALKTRHIFIDTSEYNEANHNLYTRLFSQIKSFIARIGIQIHTTDITMIEIKKQIAQRVTQLENEADGLIDKINRFSIGRDRKIPKAFIKLDFDKIKSSIMDDFDHFEKEFDVQRHSAMLISVVSVFDYYFEGRAPFDSEKSRKEFPDAFVIFTLEKWCFENNRKMYIVTKDQAMLRAASNTKWLIGVNGLTDMVDLCLQSDDRAPIADKKNVSALRGLRSHLLKAYMESTPEAFCDLQVGRIHIEKTKPYKFSIEDSKLLSVSDRHVELVLDVRVSLRVESTYPIFQIVPEGSSSDILDQYALADWRPLNFESEVRVRFLLTLRAGTKTIEQASLLTRSIQIPAPIASLYL